LAKALGLYCVVFNCSEGVDYSTMGNIFSGLVQCGGWGCFDEFNRIDAEVLSVISVQIRTIQTAMRNGLSKFQFEGNEISLDMKTGIFITMNPHYAGRSELPDNLKSMFRPVVMVVPDLELICEIMLFSQGFNQAKVLAKKQTVLYQLAKEQLSMQHHYDFGLRGIKSVLVRAGVLKREAPDALEAAILLRAIRDMNLPSFVFEDVPLFLGLINDLFPGVTVNKGKDSTLHEAIESAMKEQDYQIIPDQVEKIAQLHETMKTRHTTMIVGPTGGGKTVIIETLAKAQTLMGNPTKLFVINPKAQSVNELYGVLDPNTRDWTDGLLSSIFRDINKPTDKKDLKYIVFDGDVDTVWVENMNSVMDDNKLLTLPNGERVRLQKHCSLLFEVSDLKQASPATVSRCGMVYLDPKNLGNRVVFEKWLVTRSKLEGEILRSLFDKYIPPAIDYIFEGVQKDVVTQKLATIIPVTAIGMVKQLCSMLTVLLTREDIVEARIIESIFIFSVVWSLGASLVEDSRVLFDIFLKRMSDWNIIENPDVVAGAGQLPGVLPTLYEYFFDTNDVKWVPWSSKIPTNSLKLSEQKFYQVLIPTVETVRSTWLLEASIQAHTPLLFVGESGTAKTVTINNYFAKLDPEKYVKLTINFSSRTSSIDLQRTLESNVERWTKGTWGPSPGKHLVVFLDDLNIPAVDKYGTQQPIALLKLLIEKGGFYDRGKELNWKNLRNVQFVAAMAPPGGARNVTDPRFLSLFNIVYIPVPSTDTLSNIYSTILGSHLEPFHDGIKEVGQLLTGATLKLYNSILAALPATPSKFHYLFNLRDLSRVYEGLCLTSLDKFDTRESFVRLWRNEALRVFSDRLISKEDRKFVSDKLTELIAEFYPEEAFSALSNPLVFGDFKVSDDSIRVLEDYKNYEGVKPYFEETLLNYNEKNIPMNLVLFDDAIEHLIRILRVIRRPRGHALLVGIPGSGKQSLARLSAFVARYSIFEISLSRAYGEAEFKEDLKKLYNILGIEGKETLFLFTESHLAKEAFMEYLNNMLTAGIVPTLYSDDEKDSIVNIIRDEVVKARIFDSKENCWNYFINKCRDNLHIVICMSPGEVCIICMIICLLY
jgi:dynein heavy chain